MRLHSIPSRNAFSPSSRTRWKSSSYRVQNSDAFPLGATRPLFLGTRPIGTRLAGTVVAALALVGGGRDAPEKIAGQGWRSSVALAVSRDFACRRLGDCIALIRVQFAAEGGDP